MAEQRTTLGIEITKTSRLISCGAKPHSGASDSIGNIVYDHCKCSNCKQNFSIRVDDCIFSPIGGDIFCRCPNTDCKKLVCVATHENSAISKYLQNRYSETYDEIVDLDAFYKHRCVIM
jgi:hypothetical protein